MEEFGISIKGGLARGFGAFGVAQYLYEKKAIPKVFAGSSSGSMVAAALATGYKPEEASEILSKFSFWKICTVKSVLTNASLVDVDLYRKTIKEFFGDKKIEDLPNKLIVFTTDPKTKKRVFVEKGSVVEALMASSSYRPIFPPIKIDGRQLIDGTFSEDYSVNELKKHGVKKILGVANEKSGKKRSKVDVEVLFPIKNQSYVNFQDLKEIIKEAYKQTDKMWPSIKTALKKQ